MIGDVFQDLEAVDPAGVRYQPLPCLKWRLPGQSPAGFPQADPFKPHRPPQSQRDITVDLHPNFQFGFQVLVISVTHNPLG